MSTQYDFDWLIYADATFAGLSALIPIPFVDSMFEDFFRRRMVKTIATRRDQQIPKGTARLLNQEATKGGCVSTLLAIPTKTARSFIVRLSRKIVYVFALKSATDNISYYWSRAFLIDHMMQEGYLNDKASAQVAQEVLLQVLQTTKSPLTQVAGAVTSGVSRRILRTLRLARRGEEDENTQQARDHMQQRWNVFEGYFRTLAERYDRLYQRQHTLSNTMS
ncbi:MAG: hypothetical protein GFH27_549303n199 [Chloroflexi bacterium AL-W]|nr:hypothetical protein [Chloroflexi bacterium AL-N1]NOK68084.1 hypothetical protein [Chloroflexi bacterium AL-N10]NOK73424.1 hypothetical protein [Chloroflexi bacterium AL-N5]NOK83338.1 hypothetical protein [Chloroflexi bacterium AL-W]NOK87755.1 hypothetical protein [Chloroflexi bacterium AL-N15]